MKKYSWFYFLVLAVLLFSGAAAFGGGNSGTIIEIYFPLRGPP
jgi:hypothetical protein